MGVTYFLNNIEGKSDYIKILKEHKKVIGSLELSAYTRLLGIEGLVFKLDEDASKEDKEMLKYIAKKQLGINEWSEEYFDIDSEISKSGAAIRGDEIIIYDPKKIDPIMRKLMNNGEFCVLVGKNIGTTVLTGTYSDSHTEAIVDFFSKCLDQLHSLDTIDFRREYGKDLKELSDKLHDRSKN